MRSSIVDTMEKRLLQYAIELRLPSITQSSSVRLTHQLLLLCFIGCFLDTWTVGDFLGGQYFSSCAALANMSPTMATASGAPTNMASVLILMMVGGLAGMGV
jgi:hypothetical protein